MAPRGRRGDDEEPEAIHTLGVRGRYVARLLLFCRKLLMQYS